MRVLLVLSLIGNIVLAAFLFSRSGTSLYYVIHSKAAVKAASAAENETQIANGLIASLRKNDPVSVRDRLRALGFSDIMIRSVLRAMIYAPVNKIHEQITASQQKKNFFWKMPLGMFSYDKMTSEQRLALREANRTASKQMEDLMGPDPYDASSISTNFLPSEKGAKVRALERDYSDMRSQIVGDSHDFRIPADDEKLAYIAQEQRADLVALLTPEELADYDLHNSPTASRLRFQLQNQGFDATEAEYKAIFATQKAIDDQFAGNGPVSGSKLRAYNEAQAQANADLRASLGDARYADYQHSQDPDYRALQAAAQRFNLPDTAVAQSYAARDQALASAQIIANNVNLTDDQRRQQLQELADQTRTQVQSTLGNDAGAIYLTKNMGWLEILQSGTPIAVGQNGMIRPAPVQQTRAPLFPSLSAH